MDSWAKSNALSVIADDVGACCLLLLCQARSWLHRTNCGVHVTREHRGGGGGGAGRNRPGWAGAGFTTLTVVFMLLVNSGGGGGGDPVGQELASPP